MAAGTIAVGVGGYLFYKSKNDTTGTGTEGTGTEGTDPEANEGEVTPENSGGTTTVGGVEVVARPDGTPARTPSGGNIPADKSAKRVEAERILIALNENWVKAQTASSEAKKGYGGARGRMTSSLTQLGFPAVLNTETNLYKLIPFVRL